MRRSFRRVGVLLVAMLLLQMVGLTVVSAAPVAQSPMPGMPGMAGMPGPIYHIVRPGETLFSIGRLYGASPYQIAWTNGIPNPNMIYIGQMLFVFPGSGPTPPGPFRPGPGPSPVGPWPGPGGCISYHRVCVGETLFSLGRLYGVNPWAIARANCLINPNIIFAGQVLCIPAPEPFVIL